MDLKYPDRARETTTTTGTGTFTLAGAVSGYRTFAAVGNGNGCCYIAFGSSGEWERGIGTYTASGTTLSRDIVIDGTAGAGTHTTFSAGTKTVLIDSPPFATNGQARFRRAVMVGSETEYVISSIPQYFTHLRIRFNGDDASGSLASCKLEVKVNGSVSDWSDSNPALDIRNGSPIDAILSPSSYGLELGQYNGPDGVGSGVPFGGGWFDVMDYANTTRGKQFIGKSYAYQDEGGGVEPARVFHRCGTWKNNAAITALTLSANDTFSAGFLIEAYGIG